jgi:hypothetical protein
MIGLGIREQPEHKPKAGMLYAYLLVMLEAWLGVGRMSEEPRVSLPCCQVSRITVPPLHFSGGGARTTLSALR